ncbi:MAG: hypothetical protein ACI3ZK_00855 [Candidatus Cryptobacteroides sp.]
MNISDTIKELIPQSILEAVPQEKRAHVSAKIVKFVKDLYPELSERVEQSESLDGELKALLSQAIATAAAKAREHHLEMVKLHGQK